MSETANARAWRVVALACEPALHAALGLLQQGAGAVGQVMAVATRLTLVTRAAERRGGRLRSGALGRRGLVGGVAFELFGPFGANRAGRAGGVLQYTHAGQPLARDLLPLRPLARTTARLAEIVTGGTAHGSVGVGIVARAAR